MDVVARRVSSVTEERCPYCHDALASDGDAPDEDRIPCTGCGTVHHRACVEELGRCTIAGCERPMAAPRRAAAAAVGSAATEAVRRRLAARAADFVSAHCRPVPAAPPDRPRLEELDGFFGFRRPPARAEPPPPAEVPTDGKRPGAERARGFVRSHCASAPAYERQPRDMEEAAERAERRVNFHLAAPVDECGLPARRLAAALGAIDACRDPDWQQKAELLRHVATIEREAAPGELEQVLGRLTPAEAEARADGIEERARLELERIRAVNRWVGWTFLTLVAVMALLMGWVVWLVN